MKRLLVIFTASLFYYFVAQCQIKVISNGNVAVGMTSTPQEKLHINGSVRGNASHGALRINTEYRYVDIGCNHWVGHHTHFLTNAVHGYYFDKGIEVVGGRFSSFTGDLTLANQRSDVVWVKSSTEYVGIGDSFSIELGNDTTFCYSIYGTDCYLGTNLIIYNGNPPYRYAWECKVVYGGYLEFGAGYFLSDTTASTPWFKEPFENNSWQKFILHVWDNNGNYAKDSMNVRFSRFGYLLGEFVHYLEKGDSVQFKEVNVGGGIPPLTFRWTPVTGLSDTLSVSPWCKPEISTDYYVVATDAVGCVSEPSRVYRILVFTTGINDNMSNIKNKLKLHQVNSKIIFDNPEHKQAIITLFDLSGKKIIDSHTTTQEFDFSNMLIEKGFYLVVLTIGNITETKLYYKY